MKKFLRRTWDRYSKLGKGRKKLQKWRKPSGRDNKIREKKKGHSRLVDIGYKKSKKSKMEKYIMVKNLSELEKLKGNEKVILGKIGKRKKIEMAKKAKEMKISFQNLNVKKFLEKMEKKNEPGK